MYGEIRGMYGLFQHYTTKIAETEKNMKDETMKKPEIIHEYNNFMQGVDRAEQILRYCPCCAKTVKWTKKSVLLLLQWLP